MSTEAESVLRLAQVKREIRAAEHTLDAWRPPLRPAMKSVDPLLLAVVRLSTLQGGRALTRATGFLQQRGEEVFLVTCRHVFIDPSSGHYPRSDTG
nr:hypothetical protein [uncultured Roseateles sp.]